MDIKCTSDVVPGCSRKESTAPLGSQRPEGLARRAEFKMAAQRFRATTNRLAEAGKLVAALPVSKQPG